MDFSLGSIGSCSLDATADASDLTAKITKISEVSVPTSFTDHDSEKTSILSLADGDITSDKKPSYLNLACCVNGYSNLTTYDSKIRQDINKSREVSPIRPGTSRQYCKKYNYSLATVDPSRIQNKCSLSSLPKSYNTVVCSDTEIKTENTEASNEQGTGINLPSFIQQRVERLCGEGAQIVYTPKSSKLKLGHFRSCKNGSNELSNCGKLSTGGDILTPENNLVDLPVLRHLSKEFRAQLQTISLKKNIKNPNVAQGNALGNIKIKDDKNDFHGGFHQAVADEVDRSTPKVIHSVNSNSLLQRCGRNKSFIFTQSSNTALHLIDEKSIASEKNGNFFLSILKVEQDRILSLAFEAEKYIATLSKNSEVSEEILGLLRSASGKARLLVSQKMKQFEGLCHNNLNRSPEDTFPTTIEDLQGFWDMVCLQVKQIDAVFCEIESLRDNGWKIVEIDVPTAIVKEDPKFLKCGGPKTRSVTENRKTLSAQPNMQTEAFQKREAQRKQLKELKRRSKIAILSSAQSAKDSTKASNIILSSNLS